MAAGMLSLQQASIIPPEPELHIIGGTCACYSKPAVLLLPTSGSGCVLEVVGCSGVDADNAFCDFSIKKGAAY